MSFPSGLFARCTYDDIIHIAKRHRFCIEANKYWRNHLLDFVPEPCIGVDGLSGLDDKEEYKRRLCIAVNELLEQYEIAGIIDDVVGLMGNEDEAEEIEIKRLARFEDLSDFEMHSRKIRRYSIA